MSGPDESHLVAVVLASSDAADAVRQVWDRAGAVVVLDPEHPRLGDLITAVDPTDVIDGSGRRPRPEGRPVDGSVGAVVATSGTTGEPQFVELTTAGLAASAAAVHHALDVDPARDRWLACLPLTAVAGLAIVARAHTTGTSLVVQPRFDPMAVAAAAGECSLVSLVPTTLARLLDADATAIARFRRVLLGGAPIPSALRARATAVGVHLVTTYGLTETGGGCVHDGHELDRVEIDLAPGSSEVLVRGPVVMRGYRNDSTRPEESWRGDWLRTGDVGRRDEHGLLEIVDRLKDLIITGGVNVSPIAIESAYAAVPRVGEMAVVGEPDPEWGERVVACIVPVDASDPPSLADVRSAGVDAGLRAAELPRALRLVATIPRTPSGKILRRLLR